MNTEIAVHPRLLHYGLTTANLNAMLDWYRKVLGMTVNHRSAVPPAARGHAPFSAATFLSNDEVNHRMVLFEVPGVVVDPNKTQHTRMQHVAFECRTLDDLLGTYVRLKGLGILPLRAADQGVGTALYYSDPDRNLVEINVNHYSDEWTATEHIRTEPPGMTFVDPDKMLEARKGGASPWQLHKLAVAGEFAPDEPQDPREFF